MSNSLVTYSGSIDRYLNDLHKTKILSASEEIALAQQIAKGDKKAHNTLITANLRFVVKVAKNYQNQGMALEDLIAIGNKGLIKAADKYDGSRNIKFISYAVWWIRQSILQELAEQSRIVKIPVSIVSKILKFERVKQRLAKSKQKEVSIEDISLEMKISVEDAIILSGLTSKSIELDATINEGENTLLENLVASEEPDVYEEEGKEYIVKKIFEKLPSGRYKDILKKVYGFDGHPPKTLKEIAEEMNLSRERVRQIKEEAINYLRCKLSKDFLHQRLY